MKKILTAAFCAAMASPALAQGWPTDYEGVMLQGFYWDSYSDSQWKTLEKPGTGVVFFPDMGAPKRKMSGGAQRDGLHTLLLLRSELQFW